ncbi:MAG TPA: AMP-binding protein [Gemmatimonadaceae bacterium]|nr:AMP-binding protein [Gemmatimonadaceae bacterium]
MRPIDFLYRGLTRDPAAIAVEFGAAVVSYAELVADVEALASAFQALDSTPGGRVGICAFNTRAHLTALLATYAAGKAWVPLNPRNGRTELDAMIAATRPAILVADEACMGKFSPTNAPLILGEGESGSSATAPESVRALIRRHAGRTPVAVLRTPEDAQVIKFSGGTTGQPKGVVQPLRCINTQAKPILDTFGFTRLDCFLVCAPLTHGTSCFVLPILAAGGKLMLLEKPASATILQALESGGATAVYLPPTMIYALMAEPGAADRQYPALKHLIYSAAPMPPDRIEAARAVFGPVVETVYGQVEAPQIVTAMLAHEFSLADGRYLPSVGRATRLTRIAVMDGDRRLLGPGEVGEVVVRGDLVMTGYLDMPDLTAQTIVDGWLHTGDLGALDEWGYLFLKGRLREVVISGGFNIFPADVESVLSRHLAVQECCVFGVADAKWGEALHAAVQLRPGSAATEAELIQFVKRELDSVKAPKAVHFVESLPRNPAGKVVRRAVHAQVLGREALP